MAKPLTTMLQWSHRWVLRPYAGLRPEERGFQQCHPYRLAVSDLLSTLCECNADLMNADFRVFTLSDNGTDCLQALRKYE